MEDGQDVRPAPAGGDEDIFAVPEPKKAAPVAGRRRRLVAAKADGPVDAFGSELIAPKKPDERARVPVGAFGLDEATEPTAPPPAAAEPPAHQGAIRRFESNIDQPSVAEAAAVAAPRQPAPLPTGTDDAKFDGVSRRKKQQMEAAAQDGGARELTAPLTQADRNRLRHEEMEALDAEAGGVDAIPELAGDDAEDLTRQVAKPAAVHAHKVAALEDLEEGPPLPSLGVDMDVSVLARALLPPEQVDEDDEVWDHALLLNQVTVEIARERDEIAKGTFEGLKL
ncbi:unnamed protein product [Pedinophyceae sp. YPF-701]|nr:unnamed protein product [Pedinophyceae sp. YPF-701]